MGEADSKVHTRRESVYEASGKGREPWLPGRGGDGLAVKRRRGGLGVGSGGSAAPPAASPERVSFHVSLWARV